MCVCSTFEIKVKLFISTTAHVLIWWEEYLLFCEKKEEAWKPSIEEGAAAVIHCRPTQSTTDESQFTESNRVNTYTLNEFTKKKKKRKNNWSEILVQMSKSSRQKWNSTNNNKKQQWTTMNNAFSRLCRVILGAHVHVNSVEITVFIFKFGWCVL